jgi:hypothetical protein
MTLFRTIFSGLLSAFILYLFVFMVMPRLPTDAIPAPAFYPIFASVYFTSGLVAYFVIPDHKDKKG